MKKALVSLMAIILCMGIFTVPSFAENESTDVFVTISNGTPLLVQEKITVTDTDNDGKLTIYDAIYLAHEAKFEGGAAAGFATVSGQYGLSITKLWGVENGGSYGYYLNNAMAMGLNEPVKNGDHIHAYVYTDAQNYTDVYSYFDKETVSAGSGEEISLTLTKVGFDENFATVLSPVAGAVITINGEETSFVTDADGKAVIKFENDGKYTISAKSSSITLVPPVCSADISTSSSPDTGDILTIVIIAMAAACAVLLVVFFGRRKFRDK